MSTFKKANVVMLATNEPSKIGNLVTYQKHNLAKVIREGINPKDSTVQFWNLYIISDDEIKEDDWYYDNVVLQIRQWKSFMIYNKLQHKKVIATTDVSLGLPQPSQQFIQKYIEEYNEGNVITDVLVEYIPDFNSCFCTKDICNGNNCTKKLKIDSKDNTITIKKVKDNYTKEELCQILEKYTSFIWSEVGIHYPISLGKDAKDKFINSEL